MNRAHLAVSLAEQLRLQAHHRPLVMAFTYLAQGRTPLQTLTYEQLDRRARAIAAGLQSMGACYQRVLLLFPPGLDFIAAFYGCLYAGAVAVPAYPPLNARGMGRVVSIIADAQPVGALMPAETVPKLRAAMPPGPPTPFWALEEIETLSEHWADPGLGPDSLAFLQYTSGSTSTPKGVMVTHGNVLHNNRMVKENWHLSERDVVVNWLPLYHDMGLIGNVLQPVLLGASAYLMAPMDFLRRPLSWLEAITRYGGSLSGGPNFAYDLCVRKTTPEERTKLRLDSWRNAYNGAEPIRPATLEAFLEAFGPCGMRAESFMPTYGLAEATLFVAGISPREAPTTIAVDDHALEAHRVAPAGPTGHRLVSCGQPGSDQQVRIVDPETRRECQPGRVGEIWVAGPSVAAGYWGRPETTRELFGARLADSDEGPYLRTGDLGFYRNGHLVVTGRCKDLIILRGRNLYPQDIEACVESAHSSLRPGAVAAFTIDVGGEAVLVVVAEVERRVRPERDEPTVGNLEAMHERLDHFTAAPAPFPAREVLAKVRQALSEAFEAPLHDLALIKATTIFKTSSGKIRRSACRDAYLAGELQLLDGPETVTSQR